MKTAGAEKMGCEIYSEHIFLAMIDVEESKEVKTKQKQEDQWSLDEGQNTKSSHL